MPFYQQDHSAYIRFLILEFFIFLVDENKFRRSGRDYLGERKTLDGSDRM